MWVKTSNLCPTLYVHDDRMKTSSAETYLGDVLTNTNKIDLNIQQRYKKGVAAVNNIFSLLQEVSFGQFYFEVALLFRSSILINSMLCSSEVLYVITQKHIQTLEKYDRFFFSRLFSVPLTCTYESYFLETNALPIRFILIGRRLMYFWSILKNRNITLTGRSVEHNPLWQLIKWYHRGFLCVSAPPFNYL